MKSIKSMFAILGIPLAFAMVNVSHGGDKGHGSVHWGYEGETGPEHWGQLSHDFETCSTGHNQSPIDISESVKTADDIKIHYKKSPLKIINNGHTIQVNLDKGSYAEIDGKRYNLLQFHFHTPSEHTVNGTAFPMEVHLVHKSSDDNLAVIGVMMREGKKNSFIQTVWDNLPEAEGKDKLVKGVSISADELLPAGRKHYKYSGSLTTPPCTEGVNWNVMVNPIELSGEQVKKFMTFFEMNARPVQPHH